MTMTIMRATAAALALVPLAAPAVAQTATATTPADTAAASKFIADISAQGLAVVRQNADDKPAARIRFREMLRQHVALQEIGLRLIARQRATATPAQLAAYQAALPDFLLSAYADRLFDFADADLKVVRAVPKGQNIDVYTRVTVKRSGQRFDSIWSVRRGPTGYKMQNLTVSGVNLAITQSADFSAIIAQRGFDGLVAFMRQSGRPA